MGHPMTRLLHMSILAMLALPLSACGTAEDEPGVGGVSASEARALNEAAQMLDNRPGTPALPPVATQAPAKK